MKKKLLILITIIGICLLPKITMAETYDGEYSIDYLLRNYSLVTLGNQEINQYPDYHSIVYSIGDFKFQNRYSNYSYYNEERPSSINHQIEGAVLINGDFYSDNSLANDANNTAVVNFTYGSQTGNIKSFIKGTISDNAITNSQLVTDPNYIDFNKLYEKVVIESQMLADNSTHNINSPKLGISSPGIYTINNTARQTRNMQQYQGYQIPQDAINTLLIKNYNRNDLYVFNYYNEYIDYNCLPNIYVMESGASNATPLYEYIHNGNYTGNIIFNFPNAISIVFGEGGIGNYHSAGYISPIFVGNIIAPKATVYFGTNSYLYRENRINIYSSIIANSIIGVGGYDYSYPIIFKNTKYTENKKIVGNNDNEYLKQVNDYTDDLYRRDYSIKDLLKNYSLVTLGHKAIDSKSKLLQFGNTPGSVKLFHITGQALIAGDLYGRVYENERDEHYSDDGYYNYNVRKYDRVAFDLESNEVTESYVKGIANIKFGNYNYLRTVIQPWDNMSNDNINYIYQKNNLFIDSSTNYSNNNYWVSGRGTSYGPGNHTIFIDNYINFDRLYSNIVSEQKEIEEGYKITPTNGKAHIKIGGSYVIDDINDINEVIFDNFEDNKDKVTIIKVKNTGDINFPLISKDIGDYKGIVTNDYFGKNGATHLYEENTFVFKDSYYGNIIWNIPDATYIKLKEGAPFAGHMIAPNADVETEETHFAGCFIVNSIYGEGNTEAHFYPLTRTATYEVPEYDDLTPTQKKALDAKRLDKMLGGRGSEIETTILGDETQYRQDEEYYNNLLNNEEQNKGNTGGIISPIIETLKTNPKTLSTIGIIISLLTMIGLSLYVTLKCKKENN